MYLVPTPCRCGDATELDLPAGCADLVFSNWLLMYLADDEVAKLAHNMLTWVKVGGTVFFRESCFRQSGDKARGSNPTHYRNPREYFKIFDECEVVQPDGRVAVFDLVCCKSVDTYVRVKQNQNQVCWKWRKVCVLESGGGGVSVAGALWRRPREGARCETYSHPDFAPVPPACACCHTPGRGPPPWLSRQGHPPLASQWARLY